MSRFRLKFLFFLLITVFLFLGLGISANAQEAATVEASLEATPLAEGILGAAVDCNALSYALVNAPQGACVAKGGILTCGEEIIAAIQIAIENNNCQNLTVVGTTQVVIAADDIREVKKLTLHDVLAGAWKSMVSVFSKQLAYDTASWIASGGKGQKPLFITEGIGAYIKNTADNAAGTFIDEIDQQYGLDLCRPNFNVELMIKTSLTGYRPNKPSCNFTGMVRNWRTAIKDASFSVEYSNYLKAGENDIGIYLKTSSGLMDRVNQKASESVVEAIMNSGYKDLKTLTGWILTPGTMIRAQHDLAQEKAGIKESTFTASKYDFIETFLNTLVAQLLQNLKDGYFKSGSSGSSGNGFNLPNFNRFAALLNPESAPYIDGSQGAKERFLNLIEGDVKVGGPYDILNKLLNCTEASKTNPGPTDCVIDPIFAQAIRDKKLVKDLPASILNRQFVPPLSNVNPQESFSLRNIVILRKYRIVPVGWEIAARYLTQPKNNNKLLTLGNLVDGFNNTGSTFKNLVDPQWVLKAPELYCRREGYGDRNILANEQNKGIRRESYCADEQQCINEDGNGNCLAYGYCTEERKAWNLQSPKCEPRFNTCQTFQSKNGATGSYLANTLDYQDCSAQTVGCRWYSTLYNPFNNIWINAESQKVLKTCSDPNGCPVNGSGLTVAQWQQTAYTNSNGVVMATACTTAEGCTFSGESCTIPTGGVQCSLDKCLSSVNILTPFNAGFESAGEANWDARFWQESYQNDTNRQFRSSANSHSGSNSLQSLSFNNPNPLQSKLVIDSGVESFKNYKLSFWARGSISQGNVDVKVFANTQELGSQTVGFSSENWQEYFVYFTASDLSLGYKVDIRVITSAGTTGSLFFDDFDLREIQNSCASGDVFLNLGSTTKTDSEIYFDRDVQTCSSSAAGCSQFIRTKAGLGSNLIIDGSFEGYYSNLDRWANNGNDDSCVISSIDSGFDGEKAIRLNIDSTTGDKYCSYSSNGPDTTIPVELSPLPLIRGQKYVLSAKIYALKAGNYKVDIPIVEGSTNIDDYIITSPNEFAAADLYKWTTVSVSFVWNGDVDQIIYPRVSIKTGVGEREAYFDAVKLEMVLPEVSLPSAYTDYSPDKRPASQLTYLKKAPDYYNCYLDPTTQEWPVGIEGLKRVLGVRNPACANYSSVCIESEMNCELYTPVNRDQAVPGTITSADVCPSECAGYQVYKQESTSFTSSKYEQFINKAPIQACSAAAVGCDEFTNLDEVERGGEALEYYTQFRACQKPDAYDEATYYTWEGSDTTGYQLRVFELKKSGNEEGYGRLTPEQFKASKAPCTNLSYPNDENGNNICADPAPSDITDTTDFSYNSGACSVTDLNSNPDCREFYDTDGDIHYRLLSRVIYVDDNCHPYRRTQTQDDISEVATDCRANQGYFNNFNECIYMAIPDQGKTCSANLKGCREYTGNRGNSFRNIFLSDFESGAMGWQGGTVGAEATHPGGNSLTNSENGSRQFSKTVLVQKGKTYAISFWAKADNNINLDSIRFSDAPTEDSFMVGRPEVVGSEDIKIPITTNWKRYDLGPVQVNWGNNTGYFEQSLEINIPANNPVYIDNILLKELPQSVYAIENSWFTPVSCDNNFGEPYGVADYGPPKVLANALNPVRSNPGKMIGCQEYRDRSNKNWFLKSFENLCRADAVGCEQLIDTHNFTLANRGVLNEGNGNEVRVSADEFIYMVNDDKYSCKSEDKGCSALGLPTINNQNEVVGYQTAYLKNQPDRYTTDLCVSESLWCEEFIGARNVSYFKDPRGRVCEYRTESGQTEAKWYKQGTSELCEVTYMQTIGNSYKSAKVQPVGWFNSFFGDFNFIKWLNTAGEFVDYQDWVGVCPTDQNGCTEYVDPSAEVYKNEILNAGLLQDADRDSVADHWEAVTTGGLSQEVGLMAHTLYSFSVDGTASPKAYIELTDSCSGGIIVSPDSSLIIDNGNRKASPLGGSGRLYVVYNSDIPCAAKLFIPSTSPVLNLRLAQSGVYYALSNKVDYNSCNGLVDYNAGCVLFNDRSSLNYGSTATTNRNSSYLTFDAEATYRTQMGNENETAVPPVSVVAPITGDSNVILKVQSDRACYNWLYCTTYEKDDPNSVDPIYGNNDRCLDLGLCASVDEKGVCNNFILRSDPDLIEPDNYDENDLNKTGYSSVGYLFPDNIKVSGYLPYYEMTQFGNAGNITNGSFESVVDKSLAPLGWDPPDLIVPDDDDNYKSEAVGWHDYKFSVGQNTKNSPEGSRYLILNSFYEAWSEEIDVFDSSEYILSGWINSSGLNYPDNAVVIKSQIQYREHSICKGFENAGLKWCEWQYPDSLSLDSGLSWTKKMELIKTNTKTDKIQIRLKNYVDLPTLQPSKCPKNYPVCNVCDDSNKITPCELGGTAFFDDISLKPVLTVGDDSDNLLDKYVSRSCRIYPAVDSLSCRYLDGNSLYYGSYGYCLLVDPTNAKQCLQWWPVDQLQGEILNEVGGYNDRVPLDYCLDKKKFNVNFSRSGSLLSISSRAQEIVPTANVGDSSGEQMKFEPFNINDDYRSLFRFPYVEKIKLTVIAAGAQEYNAAIMLPVFQDINYDTENSEWTPWAALPICFALDNFAICFPLPVPWDVATGPLGTLITSGTGALNALGSLGGVVFGPLMGVRVIDDTQMGLISSGSVSDPIPDLDGDILGVAWFVKAAGDADVLAVGINVNGDFEVGYCDRLVRVVNSSGENKAYANRVTKGSGYINTDASARPPGPEGKYYYYDPFDYNKFLDSVAKQSPSSIWDNILISLDSDTPLMSLVDVILPDGITYIDLVARLIGGEDIVDIITEILNTSILDSSSYQSSDYQPFGAIVSPPGSPNPANWSSRQGIYNTPLLYEPPRLGGFQPPYQARMGEEHSKAGLEQLFAQSYGEWVWRWNKCSLDQRNDNNIDCKIGPVPARGGVYFKVDSATDYLSIPSSRCDDQNAPRPITGDPCYIAPKIDVIKINESDNPTIGENKGGVGLAKLAFSTKVDPDQLPITAYTIDWGDGEHSNVSGVSLRNRTNINNPFLLYHLYDFWKVKSATQSICNTSATNVPCCSDDVCKINVAVKIYDNWNKPSNDRNITLIINKN